MGGTELYGYDNDYGTASITASNSYASYDLGIVIGTGDNWGYNKKDIAYKIINKIINNIDTTVSSSIWKEYATTTATASENIYKKYHTNWDEFYRWEKPRIVPPGERMRQIIQARMAPAFHRRRTSLSIAMDVREERARQTLRRIIGDQAFKKFIRNGFITVVPKSRLTYRIYPGYGITEVYDRGIMVDRLCVVLQGNFPPTDSILMRYLLILNDEGEFSQYAIKHHVSQGSGTKFVFPNQEEAKPLTETWAALKLKVA